MTKPLVPLTIEAPGFFGLNTQQSGDVLPEGWATIMSNIAYDEVGRISARKGYRHVNGTAITNSPTVRQLFEYIDDTGNVLNILAADNKIFKEVSGTITDISGTITPPTGDNWQFANFNGWCVGYQAGHEPILLENTSSTFQDMSDFNSATAKAGSMVLSGWGRTWTVLDNTLYYSDLLVHSYAGGSSGSQDLSLYWPGGMDTATAIAEFNGFLIVFGEDSTLVYENPDDVDNLALVETLEGIGCTARDSIQRVGTDIVFLSSSGLRGLSRAIQEKSLPSFDISKHVRDDLLGKVAQEVSVQIKSVYNSAEGFYLLSLPATGQSYYFDLKFPNPDGSWKSAEWQMGPTALMYTLSQDMFLANADGYFSQYRDFNDNVTSVGTGGDTYVMQYESAWNNMGDEVAAMIKMPKNFSILAIGAVQTTVAFRWALDYSSTFQSTNLSFGSTIPSQFGIAQFGIATFSAAGTFTRKRGVMSRSGQVLKLGITATIDGSQFAIQRIDVLAKIGRLAL